VRRQRLADLGRQRGHRLVDLARRAHGALDVVAVRDRRAEHRHRRVADVLVDAAAAARDRPVDELEEAAEQPVHLLRVALGRELREAREVGEQDRHRTPLAGRASAATRAPQLGQKRAATGSAAPQSPQAGSRSLIAAIVASARAAELSACAVGRIVPACARVLSAGAGG
jgi:hypothetical protein